MGAEKGTRVVADAIGALEVEKVVGPTDHANVPLSSFWSEQVIYVNLALLLSCHCAGFTPDYLSSSHHQLRHR